MIAIRPQDVFYKVRIGVKNTHAAFPAPMAMPGVTAKLSIAFRESKTRILLAIDHDHLMFDEYEHASLTENPLVGKLGHPEDSDCNIYIDQTLEDVSKQGIDRSKIDILKIPDVESRLVALLNNLDAAFFYALGVKNVPRGLQPAGGDTADL